MPKYRAADLRELLSVPLEDLARESIGVASDEAVKERMRVALHEAAHLVASAYCRGCVIRVEICGPGTSRRTGVSGRLLSLEVTADEEAFCSFVGYAWEELNGDPTYALADMKDGVLAASASGLSNEVLLNEAREFVRGEHFALIRVVAAGILAKIPRSGALQGRPLQELMKGLKAIHNSYRPRRSPSRAITDIQRADEKIACPF